MNSKKAALSLAVIAGLLSGSVAMADHEPGHHDDKAAKGDKNSCKGHDGKDKDSCKGHKKKHDKNACGGKDGCGKKEEKPAH